MGKRTPVPHSIIVQDLTRNPVPDVLKVPPISERGNVLEIAKLFGGAEKLKEAVQELQTLLYAA